MLRCWDLALVLIMVWVLEGIAHGVGGVRAMGRGVGHYEERGEWWYEREAGGWEGEGIMRELR